MSSSNTRRDTNLWKSFEENIQERSKFFGICRTPKREKIFIVEDVIEIFTINIFGKILNKLLKNKIRNYLIKGK